MIIEEYSNLTTVKEKYNNQALKTKFIAQHDLTRRFLVFRNLTQFLDEYQKYDYLHEVVFWHKPRKFVADIEYKMDINQVDEIKPKLLEEVKIIENILATLFAKLYGEVITNKNIIRIDSCGELDDKYKFSINIVIDKLCFANYREFKNFGQKLCELYANNKKYNTSDKFIDPEFYKRADVYSHFCIRMPGHTKFGEDRPKIVQHGIDPKLGLITNVQNCTTLKELCTENISEAKKKYKILKNVKTNIETEEILALTEHIWSGSFLFRNKSGDLYIFDRICPSFCKFCNEVHHKENQLMISYFNGSLWELCRHAEGKSRFIVSINESEPMKIEAKPSQDPSRLDPLMMFPPDKDIYLIKANMKMGKTEECIKYLKDNNIQSAIIVSFRRAFGIDMKSRYENFSLYSDIAGDINLNDYPKLICQVESLSRIVYPLPKIDVVIIDEIESTWSQFSHTQMNDYHGVISTFKNILCVAKKIICMDADLSSRTIRLLKQIRTDFEDNHNYYKNKYNPSKNVKYSFLNDKKTGIALIIKQLSSDMNVVVVTNSIKTSKELHLLIATKLPNIKIGIYNSETKESKKVKHFSDVNQYWTKYNCLIYTPTITSGVNFTAKHYHSLVGLFTSCSCNVETCKQMIGRIRNIINENIYIHVSSELLGENLYPTNPDVVRDTMRYERSELMKYAKEKYNLELLTFEYMMDGSAEYYENLAYHIISENIAFDNKSKNNFTGVFIRYLKKAGFDIRTKVDYKLLGLSENEVDEIDYEFKVSKVDLKEQMVTDIMVAPTITYKEVEEIKHKTKIGVDITDDERNSMKKYKLTKYLGMELSKPITKIYINQQKVKTYLACKELYNSKMNYDFASWKKCMESNAYLKDATTVRNSVKHELLIHIFDTICFSKNIVSLMIDKSVLKYDYPFRSVLTTELHRMEMEYWAEHLTGYRQNLSKLFDMHGIPKHPKLEQLGPYDLLAELEKLLVRIYGMSKSDNTIFGPRYVIFVYEGIEYLGGVENVKNKNLPRVTIN